MKKLRMHVDDLAVESFDTRDLPRVRGTVQALTGYDTTCAEECAYTPASCACEETVMALTCRATGLQCCPHDDRTQGTGSFCCP